MLDSRKIVLPSCVKKISAAAIVLLQRAGESAPRQVQPRPTADLPRPVVGFSWWERYPYLRTRQPARRRAADPYLPTQNAPMLPYPTRHKTQPLPDTSYLFLLRLRVV